MSIEHQARDEPSRQATTVEVDEVVDLSASDRTSFDSDVGEPRPKSRWRRTWKLCFPTPGALLIALFTCVVAPASLIAVHIHVNPTFSPADEATHWDYLTRLAKGELPRFGQHLQASTIHTYECTGVGVYGVVLPPCRSAPTPRALSGGGYQYEAQQPPGYYALTVPMRWVGMNVFGLRDLTASREGGIIWLVAGLLLFWAAGRVMGLSPWAVGLGALLIASAPVVIYQSSYVTNDASSILAGSLVLLVGALTIKRPGRWIVPVTLLAGIFVTGLKLTDALAVVAMSLLIMMLAWLLATEVKTIGARAIAALKWWWPRGGTLLIGSVAAAMTWEIVERSLSIANPRTIKSFAGLRAIPTQGSTFFREALLMLQPLTGSYDPFRTSSTIASPSSQTSLDVQMVMATILQYLVLAGGLACLFVIKKQWSHWIGLVSLVVLYVGGVVLGASLFATYDANPGISGRYGLSLAPFLVLGLVACLRGRWSRRAVWLFALGSFGLSFVYML